MRPESAEWVEKAEGDFHTATREAAAADFPNFDAVCFHAQQCAEKYLKALLVESGVRFPRTHDLLLLQSLILPIWLEAGSIRNELAALAPYAVNVRYPGDRADAPLAAEALNNCLAARRAMRARLGLPV